MSVSFREKVRKEEYRIANSPLVLEPCSGWDAIQNDQDILYDCMDCDYNGPLIREEAITNRAYKGDKLI